MAASLRAARRRRRAASPRDPAMTLFAWGSGVGINSEGGAPGMLAQVQQLTPRQTEMVDLREVGRYGLTPIWADGHQTGIYTYRALRGMCQCPACTGGPEAR